MRLAHPKTRLEAITSRPKLLSAVGRMTSHGGQKKILLTSTHEAATQIKALVEENRLKALSKPALRQAQGERLDASSTPTQPELGPGLMRSARSKRRMGNGHGSRRPELFQRSGNPRPGPAGFGPT